MTIPSMQNPCFAGHVWGRFRARRPMTREHPGTPSPQPEAEGSEPPEVSPAPSAAIEHEECGPACDHDLGSATKTGQNATRLVVGISRKVGQPNYGSRGANVSLETALDVTATGDGDIGDQIAQLFRIANEAVNQELGILSDGSPPADPASIVDGQDPPALPATGPQMTLIDSLCGRLGVGAEEEVHRMFGTDPGSLSRPGASALINHLQNRAKGQTRNDGE